MNEAAFNKTIEDHEESGTLSYSRAETVWFWFIRLCCCIWIGHKWSRYHWIEFDTLLCERCAKFEEKPSRYLRRKGLLNFSITRKKVTQ